MQSHLISAEEFCLHHNIEVSFLHSLQEYGLAEMVIVQDTRYIDEAHLEAIEKWRRLYYDLHINFEGLYAISHLLGQLQDMQQELITLRNKLRRYEHETEAGDIWPLENLH